MLNIEIQNIEQIHKAFSEAPGESRRIFQAAMGTVSAIFAKYTLKGDPIPYRTGFLLASFRSQVGDLKASWFPTARYANWVNDGTAPHVIQAVNKKVLADEKQGLIFGRAVMHPGTQPTNFMQRIRDKAAPDINTLFNNQLKKVAEFIRDKSS